MLLPSSRTGGQHYSRVYRDVQVAWYSTWGGQCSRVTSVGDFYLFARTHFYLRHSTLSLCYKMASQNTHAVAVSTPLLTSQLDDLRDNVTSVGDKLEVIEKRLITHIVNSVMDPSTTTAAAVAAEKTARTQRFNELYHAMDSDPDYRRLFRKYNFRNMLPDRQQRHQVDDLLTDVAHLAAEDARSRMMKEIRDALGQYNIMDGIGVCKDVIKDIGTKVTESQSAWQGLQGVNTSGRVAFAVSRDAAVQDYNAMMGRLSVLFGQKLTYEHALDGLSDNNNKTMLAAGFDLNKISATDMQLAADRRKLVVTSVKSLEEQIHPGRSAQQFDKMQSLTLPPNLETSLRGQELIILFDAYMHQNAAHYPVAAVVSKRVSRDVDPVAGIFWKPPCASDGFAGMSKFLVPEYKKEIQRIETDFLKLLAPSTVSELRRSFNYGVGQEEVARVDVGDGISLYWALLAKYRPLDEMYRQDIEKFLYAVHMKFDRYDSSLVKTLTEISKYCSEAKALGIRLKWFLTGSQWVRKLSFRSTYAVKLQNYQKCTCDPDDCVYLLEELVREIKLVAVDEFSQPDTSNPFTHDHLSLHAGVLESSYPPQDAELGEDDEYSAVAMGSWQYDQSGKGGYGKGSYGKGSYGKGSSGKGGYGKGADDGSVVPGRRKMISQGMFPSQGTPPPMSRHMSYGQSRYPGGSNATARSFRYAQQAQEASQAMSAAALPPKGWNKDSGCFNDGCMDKRYQKFDLCTTCHRAGLECGSVVGKDKKSYKVLDVKRSTPDERLAANVAIKDAATLYRRMAVEVGMSAEELEWKSDMRSVGYDEALQLSYTQGMAAEVTGQKRSRPDPCLDDDVAAAAMSARAVHQMLLEEGCAHKVKRSALKEFVDEDEDNLTNNALVAAMQRTSASLRQQDRAAGQ